jgi:hypothetical protein
MRKYARGNESEQFRRQNDADAMGMPQTPPPKPMEVSTKAIEPARKTASCAQLIEKLSPMRGIDNPFPVAEELAGKIARKEEGWEPAVDALIGWMGHEDNWAKRKYNAFYCLKSVFEQDELQPEVHAAIVEKLGKAKNDEHHPYRELDAGKLLADASKTPDEIIGRLKGMQSGSRQAALNTLGIMVSNLAEKSPREAAAAIKNATPLLLEILSEKDDGKDTVGLGFDKAASMTAFIGWARKMPDETLKALMQAGSMEGENAWIPDEKRGHAAAEVIVNHLLGEQPEIVKNLAGNMTMKGKLSILTVQCLDMAGEPAIKPVIDEGMQAEDTIKLSAAGFTLAMMGPKALDGLFDYMTEKGDDKTLMLGFGMLSSTLRQIHGGSSGGTGQTRMADLERTVRESPKLEALLKKAESSGDDMVSAQARAIRKAMEII